MHVTLYPRPYTVHQLDESGHKTPRLQNKAKDGRNSRKKKGRTHAGDTLGRRTETVLLERDFEARTGQLAIAKPLRNHPQRWEPVLSQLFYYVGTPVFLRIFVVRSDVLLISLPNFFSFLGVALNITTDLMFSGHAFFFFRLFLFYFIKLL
ncbi:hypothetical protein SRHO_G00333290 [Serrasalmus rhombeus]